MSLYAGIRELFVAFVVDGPPSFESPAGDGLRDSAGYDATAMIAQQLGLSFDRNTVYECGAALLVVLACPNENVSEERRAYLHASLCGRALWTAHLANRDDTAAINVKPQYVFRDIKTIDRDTKFVDKRFQERLVAGRMALPFLQKAELGRAHGPALSWART